MGDQPPHTVKDLLVELKDASELMVDLAYAAVFFNDDKIADEVIRLDGRSGELLRRLRTMAMLAARSPEDAEGMAGVLWIADAIQRICAAASDVARVVAARLGIPDTLRPDLRHADEMTARVRVRDDAPSLGQTLAELSLPIRSDLRWEFDPGPNDTIDPGDVLLIRGPEEGVNLVRKLAGAPEVPDIPESDAPALSELDRAVDILVEMKDLSEAAVGLAYSSILFNNRALAVEVGVLEGRSDQLEDELESWVLRAAPEARNVDELRGLIRLGSASEAICDAARDMTWYVEQGEPLHPVVQMALEETEETGAETIVQPGSRADGKTLRDLRFETETGMFVLAIQRGARWVYRPRGVFTLLAGDRLISVGPDEGEDELIELCGEQPEPETD